MAKDPNILQQNVGPIREALFKLYEIGQRAAKLSKRGVNLTDSQITAKQTEVVTETVKNITEDAAEKNLVTKSLGQAGSKMLEAGRDGRDLTRRFSKTRGDVAEATWVKQSWVKKIGLSEKELNLRHAPDVFTRAGQAIKDTPDAFRNLADGVRLASGGERFKAGAMLTGSAALGVDAIRRATTKAPEGQSRGKRIAFAAVEGITAAALGIAAVTKITADVRMFGAGNLRAAGAGQSR